MEVSQIGMVVANTHVFFTKGEDGVKNIILHEPDATVQFDNGTDLTIKENYISSYVKGQKMFEPKGGTLDTLTKTKKPRRNKKVVRR